MHLSQKGSEIWSHSRGTIINDRVLNLVEITEVERRWQKSSAVQRRVGVWGGLAARTTAPCSGRQPGDTLSRRPGKYTELCSGRNPSKSSGFQGPHCSAWSCSDLMPRKTGAKMTSGHEGRVDSGCQVWWPSIALTIVRRRANDSFNFLMY